jgi:hypothetical protein
MEDSKTAYSFRPEDAPFVFAFNTQKDFFGRLMEPENSRVMNDVMSGVNWLNVFWKLNPANMQSNTIQSLIHEHPWTKRFGETATVIDVGCGPGTTAMRIVRAHDKLNWVMLDLPQMVPEIRKVHHSWSH